MNNWPIWSDEVQTQAPHKTHISHTFCLRCLGAQKNTWNIQKTLEALNNFQAAQDEQHVEQNREKKKQKKNQINLQKFI